MSDTEKETGASTPDSTRKNSPRQTKEEPSTQLIAQPSWSPKTDKEYEKANRTYLLAISRLRALITDPKYSWEAAYRKVYPDDPDW